MRACSGHLFRSVTDGFDTCSDMSSNASPPSNRVPHPPGFRGRRGVNWGFIGLLYTSFYMCRYNLSITNKSISDELGYSKEQMGWIITTALLAYACGQIINGLLTDRVGGKKAMLIGAAGTITMNIRVGVASFWGILGLFIAIRGIDGYMQAFGAPGIFSANCSIRAGTTISTSWRRSALLEAF